MTCGTLCMITLTVGYMLNIALQNMQVFLHLLGSNVQVLKKAKIIIQNIEEGFLKLYIFLNLFKAVTNILKKTGLK